VSEDARDGSELDRALASLATSDRLLVCCDFDGTISSLADEPSAARPVDGAMVVLDALAGLPDTWAAIVSGRALIDLTQLAGVPEHVHLVGSHGTEFEVGALLAVSRGEVDLVAFLVAQCRALAEGVPGVAVEVKPASVAVHVRRASRRDAARILAEVRSGPGSHPDVHVIDGKEVIELATFTGTKGDGLHALWSRWNISATLFAGDDTTDEAAFAALGPQDVGVKVGPGMSAARWRVENPAAFVIVLEQLLVLRQARVERQTASLL
jgi:trehalose 6-phosphate phosphatase